MKTLLIVVLAAYTVVLMVVGIWGYGRGKADRSEFAVAGRRLGPVVAGGTWLATFLSGVAVVGFTGYASLYGYSLVAYVTIPVALVGVLFLLLAPRLQTTGLSTIPELIEARYRSYGLRLISTLTVIVLSGVAVIVQLLAAGTVLHALLDIPLTAAIAGVGIVLVIYTSLGGLVSVVRTDVLQAVLMFTGLLLVAGYVVARLGPAVFTAPSETHTLFSGEVTGTGSALGWILVWTPGVMAQAFYLQRFYACKDVKTARTMVGFGSLLIGVFYTLVLILGLGAARLLPADSLGDSAYPVLLRTIGGPLGVVATVLLVAAIQSTVDSLLHIMATYATEDIYGHYQRDRSDAHMARVARLATVAMGALVILGAIGMALRPIPLIAHLQSLSQGAMGAALFLPIFAGLYWKRATSRGAYLAMIGGFTATALTYALQQMELVDVQHASHIGMIVSIVFFIGGSLLSPDQRDGYYAVRGLSGAKQAQQTKSSEV